MLRRLLALMTITGIGATAATVKIDFETFFDGDLLTNEIPGLTLSNMIILSSGVSLNEFEAPPKSGANVASDAGGPIIIEFDTPVFAVWGFFTYAVPLTLEAFDSSKTSLGTVTSVFTNNFAISGDPGSSPNEKLYFASVAGIASITVTGDPFGGSLAMDDLTYGDSKPGVVPEPGTLLAGLVAGLFVLLGR